MRTTVYATVIRCNFKIVGDVVISVVIQYWNARSLGEVMYLNCVHVIVFIQNIFSLLIWMHFYGRINNDK